MTRRGWLTDDQFERAIAATNLLPGPASTQLAIYCAWRLRGTRGALVGGLCFIVPGLVMILALSALFLAGSPPDWVRGAGAGAGAAVAAVALKAGLGVASPMWRRAEGRAAQQRLLGYAFAGALATVLIGPWLVLVLLACGAIETLRQRRSGRLSAGLWLWLVAPPRPPIGAGPPRRPPMAVAALLATATAMGGTLALVWTALKVGALSFGGGFVIIPLMQADAVGTYHWMTHGQFLNAVALGQVTPGPVVQTVAAVGYAAGGLWGGLFAALVAFSPSFGFILIGAARFERLLADARVRAFLAGAAPAAAGAIIGAAIPLTAAISESWQYAVLAGALLALFALRRGVVATLLLAGAVGVVAALLGAPLPR